MKNKSEEQKKLNAFTPQHQDRINMMVEKLNQIKNDKTITEETVKELDNLISQLLVFRSGCVSNIINWTKQGYLVE
tara:strand:- start:1903 stop:2130 length:228 start_codon:yes stop_codon:yes gene_type:complete